VGRLGIALREIALEKWDGCELRILANRADAAELLHSRQPRVLHDQRANHDVLIEERARIVAVRANAADDRRKVNDDLRRRFLEHALHVWLAREVVLSLANDHDVAAAVLSQGADDVAAEKTAAAGDQDSFIGDLHDRSTTCRPMTSTSMRVRRKQSSASAGRSTIGSFSLNEVFNNIGK